MLAYLLALSTAVSSLAFGAIEVQNIFEGPVKFAVWQHWQPSWNVEREPLDPKFRLEIGRADTKGFVRLAFRKHLSTDLTASFWGESWERTGEYEDESKTITEQKVAGTRIGDGWEFLLSDDEAFLDVSGKRIVTKINFRISDASGNPIYEYGIIPVYVRGSTNFHWSTAIDPYLAHVGRGKIGVANGTTSENPSKMDHWNGVLVRPSLQFIDRNILDAGAKIGLHRHEANQEMWLVENGQVLVSHGMAPIIEYDQKVDRIWNSKGEKRTVTQHIAEGGWIEERTLRRGEYAIIVPNPAHRGNVCAHGLLAVTRSTTFTMGAKN